MAKFPGLKGDPMGPGSLVLKRFVQLYWFWAGTMYWVKVSACHWHPSKFAGRIKVAHWDRWNRKRSLFTVWYTTTKQFTSFTDANFIRVSHWRNKKLPVWSVWGQLVWDPRRSVLVDLGLTHLKEIIHPRILHRPTSARKVDWLLQKFDILFGYHAVVAALFWMSLLWRNQSHKILNFWGCRLIFRVNVSLQEF